MAITKEKNKHLTDDLRLALEAAIRERKSFSQIKRELGIPRSTIKREIMNRRVESYKTFYGRRLNPCVHRRVCQAVGMCGKPDCVRNCAHCGIRCNAQSCQRFEEEVCPRLAAAPYVCNGCPDETRCTLRKEGYFRLFPEGDPSAAVDAKGAGQILGEIVVGDNAAFPGDTIDTSSVFHEIFHAWSRFMAQAGIWTENDVKELRKRFGDPKTGEELFNEEAAADAFRAYVARRMSGAMQEADEKDGILRKLFNLAHRIKGKADEVEARSRVATEAGDALFDQILADSLEYKGAGEEAPAQAHPEQGGSSSRPGTGPTSASFAVNPHLREEVEAALMRNPDGFYVKSGGSPVRFADTFPVLSFLGVQMNGIFTNTERVRKMVSKHFLTTDQIVALPELAKEPAAVFVNVDDKGSIAILTDGQAPYEKGNPAAKPVMIWLEPSKDGKGGFVASAYSRSPGNEAAYASWRKKIAYFDENKFASLNLEEETDSLLRPQAAGESVKNASDYSQWRSTSDIIANPPARSQAPAQAHPEQGGSSSRPGIGPGKERKWSAATPTGNIRVSGHWQAIPLKDLIHSNNPLYARYMRNQLRNRQSNKAEEDARENIVRNFDPARLFDAPDTANGAPIVFLDVDDKGETRPFVLSGNGRVMVLNALAERHIFDKYRNEMRKQAAERGIDPGEGDTVLVRVVDDYGGATREKVADLSNTNSIQQYTEEEQARADAEMVRNLDLAKFYVANADGTPNMSPGANDEFFSRFIQATGDTALYNADRTVTDAARARMMRALLAVAVGNGPRGRETVKALVDNADTLGIVRQKNALAMMAAPVAALEGNPDYAIGADVSRAVADFIDFMQNRDTGRKWGAIENYLGQEDMLDPRSAVANGILELLGSKLSASDIAAYVQAYCDAAAESEPDGGLFGDAMKRTRPDIWRDAKKLVDGKRAKAQDRFSIAANAAYLAAVKRGDMETAERMVREAAKERGYEVFGLHGTRGEFTVFDKKRIGTANDDGWLGRGFYFWDKSNRTYAEQYANGGKVMEVMLSMEEPYLIDKAEMERLIDAAEQHDVKTLEDFSNEVKANGYDSVVDGDGQMLVFEPNQIKALAPVAYDDAGNVIPLSQRFDPANPDIRYSLAVNPHLREEVEAALNTDTSKGEIVKGGKHVVFCDAPGLFTKIGIAAGTVYTKVFILRKTAKVHHLTPEQIASTPELIAKPAAVFHDSDEKHNGYVFLTDAIAPDMNGAAAPVMIYVRPDGEGNYIASEYAKTEAGEAHYINLVNAGNVLYIDKNKIARLPLRGEAKSSLITFSAGDNVVTPEGLTQDIIANLSARSQAPAPAHPGQGGFSSRPGMDRFSISSSRAWPGDFPNIMVHTTRTALMANHAEDFRKAKAGDKEAAARIIEAVVKQDKLRALAARHPDAIVVPVHAEEETGRNKLPRIYALAIARIGNLKYDESIVQTVRAHHTGADAFARLSRRAEFEGTVEPGREYILADDHVTQGGTLSELRHYIENNGGKVVEITTLTASKGSAIISPRKATLDALKEKFEDAARKTIPPDARGDRGSPQGREGNDRLVRQEVRSGASSLARLLAAANIAGSLEALTESEAQYLLKFSPEKLVAKLLEAARSQAPAPAHPGQGGFSSRPGMDRFSIGGVYTGSAADYDKPSLHYIGTGEGSQVYGWGLYGSTERGVAEGYAKSGRSAEAWARRLLKEEGREGAIRWLEHYGKQYIGFNDSNTGETLLEAAKLLKENKPLGGENLYEQTFFTDRAPGDESHLLNWYGNASDPDLNFAEQEKWIRAQAKKEGVKLPRDLGGFGNDIYETIVNTLGSPQAASEFLARAGIDGVKYPVDSYGGKTVKDGDKAGWNYVSFRDDNIRVDHKWTDGVQRYSVTTRAYNPDVQVQIVDGRNEPAFLNLTTAELRHYLRDKYQGREVTIDADGSIVLFTGAGLNSALKKRDKHKRTLHVLDALIKNSHYTRFEENDGQEKHKSINGQFVYTAALRLNDGVYGIELKLDIPKSDPDKTHFKGQTVKMKIADAALSVGPRSEEPLPTSAGDASASATVRLGDIVTTPRIVPYPSASRQGAADHVTQGTLSELRHYIENNGVQRFSITIGDNLGKREKFDEFVAALEKPNAIPGGINLLPHDVSPKVALDYYNANILGKTFTFPGGETITMNAGHFFRLTCEGRQNKDGLRKGYVSGFASSAEALAAIAAGKVEPEDIYGWQSDRAGVMPLFGDLVEHPTFILEDAADSKKTQNIKRYDIGNGRSIVAIFRILDNGKRIISFSGFSPKFNRLKDYRVAYVDDAINTGTSPARLADGDAAQAVAYDTISPASRQGVADHEALARNANAPPGKTRLQSYWRTCSRHLP